jgi:plastocyanin
MHRSRSIPALALSAILAVALAACGDDAASPSSIASDAPPTSQAPESQPASAEPSASAAESAGEAESETVRLEGFAFDTAELTIAVGTRVTFTNADSAAHTVTEGTDGVAADDPIVDVELAPNQSDTVTFDEAGTYQITCLFHPSMNMTVIVEG